METVVAIGVMAMFTWITIVGIGHMRVAQAERRTVLASLVGRHVTLVAVPTKGFSSHSFEGELVDVDDRYARLLAHKEVVVPLVMVGEIRTGDHIRWELHPRR